MWSFDVWSFFRLHAYGKLPSPMLDSTSEPKVTVRPVIMRVNSRCSTMYCVAKLGCQTG